MFIDHLTQAIEEKQSRLVVGLDPHWDRIPNEFKREHDRPDKTLIAYFTEVVKSTHQVAAAFKPQIAFFEQFGVGGLTALATVLDLIHELGGLVIMDGKRNDIGSTATAYATTYFGSETLPAAFPSHALTVNAYLGTDGVAPFLRPDKGLFVLVKTSNPSSGEFQDLQLSSGQTLAEAMAECVNRWTASSITNSGYGNVGAVVGATYPEHMQKLRRLLPHSYLLVPGYGAQGGSDQAVAAAFDPDGMGALINSSRAICFPPDFASRGFDAVRVAAELTRDSIERLRSWK